MRILLLSAAALVAGLLLGSAAGAVDAGPGFDCKKASAPDEKIICGDPLLSRVDRMINAGYATFEPAYDQSKQQIAAALLADRRSCGADRPCVATAMYSMLSTYGAVPPWIYDYAQALLGFKAAELNAKAPKGANQPMPEKIGQCAVTTIEELATRFGEPLDTAEAGAGTSVTLANGGYQVDYSTNDAIYASEVGQRVVICLMQIPRDCPTGDDRGRLYLTYNTVTQRNWALSDSQHMCGGA